MKNISKNLQSSGWKNAGSAASTHSNGCVKTSEKHDEECCYRFQILLHAL